MSIKINIENEILKYEQSLIKLKEELENKVDIKNAYFYEGYKVGLLTGKIEGLKHVQKKIKEDII